MDSVVFGYMETVFAVAMLLGGPLFGRFGDIFGAQSALLVAFTSSLLTYLVLALANSIPALFLSRVFAFMMHAMHGMCPPPPPLTNGRYTYSLQGLRW